MVNVAKEVKRLVQQINTDRRREMHDLAEIEEDLSQLLKHLQNTLDGMSDALEHNDIEQLHGKNILLQNILNTLLELPDNPDLRTMKGHVGNTIERLKRFDKTFGVSRGTLNSWDLAAAHFTRIKEELRNEIMGALDQQFRRSVRIRSALKWAM